MGAILSYSVSVAVMLAILYPIYKVCLSKERFPAYNRGVLIGIYVISLIYMPLWRSLSTSVNYEPTFSTTQSYCPEFADQGAESAHVNEEPASTQSMAEAEATIQNRHNLEVLCTIVLWIYLAGIVAVLLHTVFMWLKVATLIRGGIAHKYTGYTLIVITHRPIAPFSWMHYLVINESDLEENPELIISHELQHIRHGHWFDIVFAQLVNALNWYNPVAWTIQKELRNVHEYQADQGVISGGINPAVYQMLLIKRASSSSFASIVNNFNQSKLKNRLYMMWNSDINTKRKWRATLLIPGALVGLAISASAFSTEAETIVSSATLEYADNEPPSAEKVQRVFSMVPVRKDSTIVKMSDGKTRTVKMYTSHNRDVSVRENKSTSSSRRNTKNLEVKARNSDSQNSESQIGMDEEFNRKQQEFNRQKEEFDRQMKEHDSRMQEFDRQREEFAKEFEKQRRQYEREYANAMAEIERSYNDLKADTIAMQQAQEQRDKAQRKAQIARDEAQRKAQIARDEAQRKAQQARAKAQIARDEAQRKAQIARDEAQKQAQQARAKAQKQRAEAQRKAQQERAKAQKQRDEAQRKAQIARDEAQKQAQHARIKAQKQRAEAQRKARQARSEAQRQAKEQAKKQV